jgi:hypothetical protein
MEIKRYDLINHLIRKHGLKSYCEIGTQNRNQNFDKIVCYHKYCVDPDINANADFVGTSDDFFAQNKKTYDLYFLDGLHTAEQVKKDFQNSLKVLSPNGFIVLHDCNPLKEEHTIVPRPTVTGHWNGSCYEFASALKCEKYTVDIDNGCMVIPYPKTEVRISYSLLPVTKKDQWSYFDRNRKELLNLISWQDFINL